MTPLFVGRVPELEALCALLDDARAGHGHLALLSGEPGIGKSRLAEELTRRAEASGFRTAWGRSWEGAGTPAFWPWTQVLRRLHSFAELRDALAGEELRPLLDPSIARAAVEHAAGTPSPAAGHAEAGDAAQARFRLFDGVARALDRAARVHPLLVVLDDLHAADSATLALLHFVARGLHGAALAVVATSREAAFAAPGAGAEMLARIAREARPFALARLAPAELAEWLASAAPALAPERVWAASEGNPLFVEELIAAERRRPGAAWTGSHMPHGLRDAVRGHLVLLPEAAQLLLETASALGREPTGRMLAAIASPAEMLALDDAIASGVLVEVGEGRLRFSHILLRDELYSRLSADRRRSLHRGASRASDGAEAAHHALCAATPDDAREALGPVRRAMSEAAGRLAHEDASALGRRALDALGEHLDGADRCALEVETAEALATAGHLQAGKALGERAAARAATLGDAALLARAALVRAAELTFAHDDGAAHWLRQALDALGPADSSLRATLMARLSVALQNSSSHAHVMRELRDSSIAMARRVGDEKALLAALYSASASYPVELGPRERFTLYAEVVALAERVGTVARIAPLLPWHVASFLDVGDPDGAAAAADRVEALLAPFRQPELRWRMPLVRAVLAAVAGRFDEADRLARESLALSREHGLPEGLMMNTIFLISLPYVRGDEAGLREELPWLDAAIGGAPQWSLFRALVDAPLGRIDAVRESFAKLRALPVEEVVGAGQLGWACVRADLREDAELFHRLCAETPLPAPLSWAPGAAGCMGPARLLQGQLAARTGRHGEAAEHLRDAAAFARTIRSPPFVALSELAWAELCVEAGSGDAAAHARTALQEAEVVGMAAVAERARAIAGGAPRRAEPQATSGAPTLHLAREGELWALVAGPMRLLLRDTKGMAYLEVLLEHPHRAIHALELAGIDERGDAGPVLDERAKAAYRARAEELRAELEEAEQHRDPGRIGRAREELDALGAELARALGLGGRERRAGSLAERARINVQRRLKDVLRRVAEQDAALGRHLELSVKTGLFCMYAPTWPAS